jgi:hypothetical protein
MECCPVFHAVRRRAVPPQVFKTVEVTSIELDISILTLADTIFKRTSRSSVDVIGRMYELHPSDFEAVSKGSASLL